MLLLVMLPVVFVVARVYDYLQLNAPANVSIPRVRAAAPRWRTAAGLTLLAATLLMAMHVVAEAVVHGAPGWMNLIVPILAWDSIRLGLLACITAVRRVVHVVSARTTTLGNQVGRLVR
ncbi:hypothetical protein EXE58_18835 [Nocardioides seonyuensis]|uniref:Uncharacterized protein n=1 Tax=Nocardioides seonyuensis TaxID=2518371 RepID=A0A4P7IIM9_9ACTN|nr:hypothetical protein [Nocardioides seonyuensis]QBX57279.1 hypothetical protein EXE58_18835 [Nocardioides seonyuensis]